MIETSIHADRLAPLFKENDKPKPEPSGLLALPTTDAGNGEAFAMLYGDRVRYDHRRRRWLVWNCTRWQPDPNGQIEQMAKQTARKRFVAAAEVDDLKAREQLARWAIASESDLRRRAMLRAAMSEQPIADEGEGWDYDPWLLGCENSVIDLKQGTARAGLQNDRLTMSTGIFYNPQARADRWKRFLGELWQDPDLLDYVQRAVGYALSGDVSEQCLFLLYGTGANGKSVFLSTLRHALGDYAGNTPFGTFEAFDRGSGSNDVAALLGKRLVTASEVRESARLNEARIKVLTGGDALTARFLYSEFFTFTFSGKIFLALNHKPRVSDESYGFWRRIRLIPFTRKFGPEEADPRLVETLRLEAAGILNWAIQGCLEWQRRGLQPPKAITDATEVYRAESDPLANFFEERAVIGEQLQAEAAQLYRAYLTYCEDYGERHPLSANSFGRRLGERGFRKDRTGEKRASTYHGIGLAART